MGVGELFGVVMELVELVGHVGVEVKTRRDKRGVWGLVRIDVLQFCLGGKGYGLLSSSWGLMDDMTGVGERV